MAATRDSDYSDLLSKSELYEMYWGDMDSTYEIAEQFGVSQHVVRDFMESYGIPRRSKRYNGDNTVSPFTGFYQHTVPYEEVKDDIETVTETAGEIRSKVVQVVNNNRALLRSLPDVPFIYGAADLSHEKFHQLKDNDIIETVGKARLNGSYERRENSDTIALWALTPEARSCLRDCDESVQMEMPCSQRGQPHTGFLNDGEYLKCKVCGGRFSKQEVREYNA